METPYNEKAKQISKTVGIMSKLKNILLQRVLKTICLSYGITAIIWPDHLGK